MQSNGVGRGLNHDGVIHFGLVGSADLLGLFKGGLFLAFEVKTGLANQTRQQRAFAEMITGLGGFYRVVSSADEVEEHLNTLARLSA